MRRHLGSERVEAALGPHRALSSLVLRGLLPSLSDAERARRDGLAAQPLGFMSHGRISSGPLAEALADALAPLFLAAGVPVVIPNALAIDPTTLTLVRRVESKLAPGEGPDFVLVRSPAPEPAASAGGRVISQNEYLMGLLEAIPSTRREVVDESEIALGSTAGEVPTDPLDDGAELRAWDALTAAQGVPDEPLRREVLAAMRLAFASFGHAATSRLGLELLSKCPDLPREEAAEVHRLIGLSEYARRARSGDRTLAPMLDHHFRAAFEVETDPARRSHLLYRLCTTTARLGRHDDAISFAERGVEAAHEPGVPEGTAAYLEAWARNGRAYVHSLKKETDIAVAECIAANRLIDRAAQLSGAPERELVGSRIVFNDNLAELHLRMRDPKSAAVFQGALEDAERAIPEGMKYGPHRWVKILRAQGKLRQAAARAEEGFALARKNLAPFAEDRFAMELGELSYRTGNAPRARESYLAALTIRERIGSEVDKLRASLGAALAARRSGLLDEALAAFTRALDSSICAKGSARAEVLAALALVAAQRGDEATAAPRLAEARDAAESAASPEALVRVARAAGEAYLLLDRRDEAQTFFSRALATVDEGAPELRARTASETMGALVGLRRAGERDPAIVLRALSLAPAALADAEATWDLPALLQALLDLADERLLPEPSSLAGLRAALRAGAERDDCERLVRSVEATLAPNGLSPG
ncbi:hypothetical protein [Polyangium aurulentum]|uniref:tetratricopeptide repeat protein n=1 Tax=Polyangium aurulentum TaxID=2567896 RepID=UPI0010AEBB72|nr:hypothetical protein [Polyangium aurulentum]UQA60874.1 hypothetical protein E8A73_010485 [Polyangium aurulentum]